MNKKVNLKIEPPAPNNDGYSLTTSGTFKEGDLLINKKGLLIKGESPKNSTVNDRNKNKSLHSNLNPQLYQENMIDIQQQQQHYSPQLTGISVSTPTASSTNSFNNTFTAMYNYNNNLNQNNKNNNIKTNNNNNNNNNVLSSNPYNNNNNNNNVSSTLSSTTTTTNSTQQVPQYDSNLSLDLKDLKIIKILGRGAGGVVKLAYHETSDTYIALKVITLDIQENIRKQIILELKTLHKTYCPYIVSFYDAFYTDGSIFIALEYMELGSLSDIMKRTNTIPEPVLGKIAYQVLQGLTYLHRKLHLIHRDIKPSNILVNLKGEAKIADFGVSGQLQHTLSKAVTWVGTVTYMSPERISGRSYSFDSDIWSLGLTILECAIGKFPYGSSSQIIQNNLDYQSSNNNIPQQQFNSFNNCNDNNNNSSNNSSLKNSLDNNNNIENSSSVPEGMGFWVLLDCIVKEDVPNLPSNFSKEFRSFISECLQKEPAERPIASNLLSHEFIKKHQNYNVGAWVASLKN